MPQTHNGLIKDRKRDINVDYQLVSALLNAKLQAQLKNKASDVFKEVAKASALQFGTILLLRFG